MSCHSHKIVCVVNLIWPEYDLLAIIVDLLHPIYFIFETSVGIKQQEQTYKNQNQYTGLKGSMN